MQSKVSRTVLLSAFACCLASGCSMPWVSKEEEKDEFVVKTEAVKELLTSNKHPRLIGEAAKIVGLAPQQFEAFGIVNELPGTGGDIKTGPQREYVLKDLRARAIENPNAFLASKDTAVVKIKANVRPGIRAGERVDLIVQKSIDCDATNIRNGKLLPTRLLELVTLGGRIRESDLKANAAGYLVTIPPSLNSTKDIDKELALVLGGGVVVNGQNAYLRLDESVQHVMTVKKIVETLNERFEVSDSGKLKGIAEGKTDRIISLTIPTAYEKDIAHFSEVIESVAFNDRGEEKSERLANCQKELRDPKTAKVAAAQLEAIGESAIQILKEGLTSSDATARFHAAYSLAYLGDTSAVQPLMEIVVSRPELRGQAMLGIAQVDSLEADEALRSLMLNSDSAICYPAVRNLRDRKAYDPSVSGVTLGKLGRFTEVASPNKLIVASLEREQEIAIFGGTIPLSLDINYEVNSRITVRNDRGMLRLVHFQPSGEDMIATAEPTVQSFLEALASINGTYSDAIIFLDVAKSRGWVNAPVTFYPFVNIVPRDEAKAIEETTIDDFAVDLPQDVDTIPVLPWWNVRRYFAP